MNAPDTLDFYAIVLFLHILSAIVAFGATFAYPLIDAVVRRVDVRAVPTWNEARYQIGMRIITPGAIVLLGTGIYMVLDRWKDAGSGWFTAAGIIVVVLLGLGHGVLAPNARRMRDQALRDLDGGAGESGRLSADYEALARKEQLVGITASLLVVAALFLMVVKPGA
jgi:uncharacterized membrane protein